MSLIWSRSLCLSLWIKVVVSLLALPHWEHLKGHNLLAPSNATVVSLGPARSPVAPADAGDPSTALEPSLDKQDGKGCLMEKVGGNMFLSE